MEFGLFEHMDDSGVPLGQQFESRLSLLEACGRYGFYAYHLAEHHGTPLGRRVILLLKVNWVTFGAKRTSIYGQDRLHASVMTHQRHWASY
jgi:hypothetical protein